jgi:hypothetical protein
VTPQVAQKDPGSAIDGRTTRHAGYRVSLKIRKRVEEIFGWSKTIGGLHKTRFRGLKKVSAQALFVSSADNPESSAPKGSGLKKTPHKGTKAKGMLAFFNSLLVTLLATVSESQQKSHEFTWYSCFYIKHRNTTYVTKS